MEEGFYRLQDSMAKSPFFLKNNLITNTYDGAKLGAVDGAELGSVDGAADGTALGAKDGAVDGAPLGPPDGAQLFTGREWRKT